MEHKAINWQSKFSHTIYYRGLIYYREDRVFSLTKISDKEYSAKVLGHGTIYDVTVKIIGNSLLLTCSCPYAETTNCKHMVAVCKAIEEKDSTFFENKDCCITEQKKPEKTDSKKQLFSFNEKPFSLEEKLNGIPSSSYYNLNNVLSIYTATYDSYNLAEYYVKNGQAKLRNAEIKYMENTGDPVLCLEAKLSFDQTECVKLNITKNKIINLNCDFHTSKRDCYQSDFSRYTVMDNKKVLCVHKLALLILAEDFIKKNLPGDCTDLNGFLFTEKLKKLNKKEIVKPSFNKQNIIEIKPKTINITPIVKIGRRSEYSVSFSINADNGKSYKIKSFNGLRNSYNLASKEYFGKELSVDFSTDTLNLQAQHFFDFIKYISTISFSQIGNEISLDEDSIEVFYTLFENDSVFDEFGCPYVFTEEKLKFNTKIEPLYENGEFQGLSIFIQYPSTISGKEGKYYINFKDKKIVKIPNNILGPLNGLIDSSKREFKAKLGKGNLSKFYSEILPALEYYGPVEMTECSELKNFEDLKPTFVFNLDYSNKKVFCQANVKYTDKTFKLNGQYNTQDTNITRNKEDEENTINQLYELFENNDDNIWTLSDSDGIFLLLSQGLSILMQYGEVNTTDSFNSLKYRKISKVTTNVSMESNLLELNIQTDDMTTSELLELIDSYKKHKVYHRLKDGSFVDLNTVEVKEISEFLAELNVKDKSFIKGKIKIPAFRALYLSEILKDKEVLQVEKDSSFRKVLKDFETFKDSEAEVPKSLANIIRPYQLTGFRWLATLGQYNFSGILADEMGLGKTIQVLAYLLYRKENKINKPSLIVCPASLVYNWYSEVQKFTPTLKAVVVAGKQSEREALLKDYEKYNLIITSYDLLKRDIPDYQNVNFDCMIVDEAQFIKNSNTEASKAVKAINSDLHFALTGTPIENRLSELWSIFDFLMPTFLYSKDAFRRDFEMPIMKNNDSTAMDKLRKMTGAFILRRLKTNVLKDLPTKLEENRFIELGSMQRKLYDAQVAKIIVGLKKTKEKDFKNRKIEVLAELTKLRQICCDPSLAFENCNEKSAKRNLCTDLIKSAIDGGHKVLVFSQFTSMLALLEKDLNEENIKYYKIEGSTDKLKRYELVDAFNENNVPVFLISLKAGGTGLNLVGADIVIHYDPWWNVAAQNQATDRAHRIGQKNVVTVYKLLAKNTIEEKILELQEKKKELAEGVLSSDNVSISALTKEDILEILS